MASQLYSKSSDGFVELGCTFYGFLRNTRDTLSHGSLRNTTEVSGRNRNVCATDPRGTPQKEPVGTEMFEPQILEEHHRRNRLEQKWLSHRSSRNILWSYLSFQKCLSHRSSRNTTEGTRSELLMFEPQILEEHHRRNQSEQKCLSHRSSRNTTEETGWNRNVWATDHRGTPQKEPVGTEMFDCNQIFEDYHRSHGSGQKCWATDPWGTPQKEPVRTEMFEPQILEEQHSRNQSEQKCLSPSSLRNTTLSTSRNRNVWATDAWKNTTEVYQSEH